MIITLRCARIFKGYSVLRVAKKCNVSANTISKYERDSSNITVGMLRKMLKLYNVPIDIIHIGSTEDYVTNHMDK